MADQYLVGRIVGTESGHAQRTDNPHNVTAAQVGAMPNSGLTTHSGIIYMTSPSSAHGVYDGYPASDGFWGIYTSEEGGNMYVRDPDGGMWQWDAGVQRSSDNSYMFRLYHAPDGSAYDVAARWYFMSDGSLSLYGTGESDSNPKLYIGGKVVGDFVVASDTSEIATSTIVTSGRWRWRKWASGQFDAFCWAYVNIQSSMVQEASNYYYTKYIPITTPFSMLDGSAPTITGAAQLPCYITSTSTYSDTDGTTQSTGAISFRLVSPSQISTGNHFVRLSVCGNYA